MKMHSIPLDLALFVAITFAASVACYYTIEKPAINLAA
jgi:hypothetical protein